MAGVGVGGLDQQVADRRRQQIGLVGGLGGVQRDPPQLRRQRRRPVEVAAPLVEALAEHRRRVAVAAVLEHPRDQLLDRLLGAELAQLLRAGQQQPRLQLQQRCDQDQELGRDLEVELVLALEVLDVGEHDVGELDLEQADLLAQHDRQQQVEGAREDIELKVERGDRHRREG